MSFPGDGAQAGGQAQTQILLQLIKSIADAMTGSGGVPTGLFQPVPFVGVGNLDIAVAYPKMKAGMFSIRKAVAAATTVFLPATDGPWVIADGNGGAVAHNITVQPKSGAQTILNAATYVVSANWAMHIFVLDSANFLVL